MRQLFLTILLGLVFLTGTLPTWSRTPAAGSTTAEAASAIVPPLLRLPQANANLIEITGDGRATAGRQRAG